MTSLWERGGGGGGGGCGSGGGGGGAVLRKSGILAGRGHGPIAPRRAGGDGRGKAGQGLDRGSQNGFSGNSPLGASGI